jgi:hypothetical protein
MGEESIEPAIGACDSNDSRGEDVARGSAEYCLSRSGDINRRICGEGKAAHSGVRRHRIPCLWVEPAIWKSCRHQGDPRLCHRRRSLDRLLFVHRHNGGVNRGASLLPPAARILIHFPSMDYFNPKIFAPERLNYPQ